MRRESGNGASGANAGFVLPRCAALYVLCALYAVKWREANVARSAMLTSWPGVLRGCIACTVAFYKKG
jgi:hypothetical protein